MDLTDLTSVVPNYEIWFACTVAILLITVKTGTVPVFDFKKIENTFSPVNQNLKSFGQKSRDPDLENTEHNAQLITSLCV